MWSENQIKKCISGNKNRRRICSIHGHTTIAMARAESVTNNGKINRFV